MARPFPLVERIVIPIMIGVISIICPILLIWSCVSTVFAPFLQDGNILHTISNPSGQITALVVSDSCGITCDCTVRVDIRTPSHYHKAVLRRIDVCDADIVWLSNTAFEISSYARDHEQFDIRTLGADL